MTNSEPKKKLLLPVITVLAVLAGLMLVLYLPSQLQTELQTEAQGTVVMPADSSCSLNNGQCASRFEDKQIALEIKSETIRSATPMVFEVKLDNMAADQVMLDLKGKEMFMGLNQVMLKQVAGQPNLWQGEVTLAVCTTGEMEWISSVVTEKAGVKTQADFSFMAK